MADTLESLEVKIEHSASGADAQVAKLANAINGLKAALKDLPSEPLKNLASTFKEAAGALKGANTGQLTKFAEAMANVAASAELLGENSGSIAQLAESMTSIAGVKVTAGSFNALATGVKSVGEASKAITPGSLENLDKMVTSLAKLQGVDLQGLGSAMRAVGNSGRSAKPKEVTPVPAALQEIIRTSDEVDVLTAKLEYLHEALSRALASGDAEKAYTIRGQILQTEKALEKAQAAANQTGKEMDKAAKGIDKVAESAKKTQKPMGNFLSSLKRIAFYRFIRTVIKSISQAFTEGLKNAYLFSSGLTTEGHRFAAAMDSMKSASTQMKNQLGAAFIALLTAIEPVVTAIINLIIKLADAVSQFISAFTGKTYLKSAGVLDKFADDMASGAKSAKEWKNQLLGFDVINRLNEPSDGGDWGGLTPEDMFGGIDSPIDKRILDFANSLKFNVKDIFFDWNDLTGEQIAKKVITGLGALVGAGVGFTIGGVPGAIVGALLGATLGVVFSSLVFDNDGQLSRDEVLKMVCAAAGALAGGAVGFMIGGPFGGAIGAVIGAGLGLHAHDLIFGADGENKPKALRTLIVALSAIAGGIIGFALGGPLGGIIGATIGAGVGLLVSNAIFNKGNATKEKMFKTVIIALGAIAGGALGFMLGGPLGAIIGVTAGAAIGLIISSAAFNGSNMQQAIMSSLVVALGAIAGGLIGFSVAGIPGAVIGAIIGVSLTLSITKATWDKGSISPHDMNPWKIKELQDELQDVAVGTTPETAISISRRESSNPISSAMNSIFSKVRDMNDIVHLELADDTYAAGGYPSTGQMFIAREAGPELVGTIGNQTAVANNDQIVEAVSRGVANAVSAVLGRGGKGQEIHVYLDSREIKYGQSRLSRAMGV